MTTIPDHYAALGIDPTADPEVITAAYRALAKKFHPDTGATGGTASAERFEQVQKAYEVLRDPASRHAYDLELLAATERELADHIASKRRVVPLDGATPGATPGAGAAGAGRGERPDLGGIRPEPATSATGAARRRRPRTSLLPYLVPVLLLLAIIGGATWAFLPSGPEAPPLPGTPAPDVTAQAPAAKPAAPAQQAAAPSSTTTTPESAPAATPAADQPVFGSTGGSTALSDGGTAVAASAPVPVPAPDAPAAGKSDMPVFGSAAAIEEPPGDAAAEAAATAEPPPAPVPPVPKARPAPPVKPVPQAAPKPARPAASAKPAAPSLQQQAQQRTRARLQYQNPPQYDPEPDGYPPPGYEPPGYGDPYAAPPGYAAAPPPGFRPPGNGPFRLVIFESRPGQPPTAWSAGVVFKSMGKCTKQGVKAVLRRTSSPDPYAAASRVWFECQPLAQR